MRSVASLLLFFLPASTPLHPQRAHPDVRLIITIRDVPSWLVRLHYHIHVHPIKPMPTYYPTSWLCVCYLLHTAFSITVYSIFTSTSKMPHTTFLVCISWSATMVPSIQSRSTHPGRIRRCLHARLRTRTRTRAHPWTYCHQPMFSNHPVGNHLHANRLFILTSFNDIVVGECVWCGYSLWHARFLKHLLNNVCKFNTPISSHQMRPPRKPTSKPTSQSGDSYVQP